MFFTRAALAPINPRATWDGSVAVPRGHLFAPYLMGACAVTGTSDTLGPCEGFASAPTPKRSDPHRVDRLWAGRGTTDFEPTRVPDSCSSSSCEPGYLPQPWFWTGKMATSLSITGRAQGCVVRPSTHVDDLAPAFRKASARYLEPKSAIDERYVCPCCSVMRSVRPSGTPAKDSPSAPGVLRSFVSKRGLRAGDGLHRAHRGADSSQPNDSGAAAKRHPRHRRAYPDGDRSIRPRVTPLTYPRSETRDANAGSPRSNRFFVFDRWLVRGASRSVPPRREQGPEGTRSLLSSLLLREHGAAGLILARPPMSFWLDHRESFLVRAAPYETPESISPLPAVPRPAALRLLQPVRYAHRVRIADRNVGHSTPLVVAHGALVVWRHHECCIDNHARPRTLSTTDPAKDRPHRWPEVPSIESTGVMRSGLARDRPF